MVCGAGMPWHVFLNHRGFDETEGTDDKREFVGFLHERLGQLGFQAFMDEKSLCVPQHAWETILAAIRSCKIAIAVFSKSYGRSRWCLEELAEMAERCKSGHLKIIPIFLGGSFEEVCQQVKRGIENLTSSGLDQGKRQLWQAAFSLACDFTGQRLDQESG